ncbi:protein translocase subunit SecF [Oscillatoriales cyanobacterium LEGE 11467]|uniref:Protein-export membrane protein SecF n=1 Tax=Zarconia navalis LEGE 11467 TaxID=1828826 RepID=A0A928ZAF0_9CYAN|nr:protein translocase subunit SecF [Zarconia navalis]MBE9041636.1 protein translocase subunit SecF [Zarconia navalis LEGE 11467]
MKLNIIKQRPLWWSISGILAAIGAIAMAISLTTLGAPVAPSLDFVGGTRLQLELDCSIAGNCESPIELDTVREIMSDRGLDNRGIQVVGAAGRGLSIRTLDLDVDDRTQLLSDLEERIGQFDPQSTQIDTVGPTIGRELLASGLMALIFASAGIIIYLSVRFQLDYAICAIIALFHDVFITVGMFSIFGLTLGWEVDSLFIVALLTIIGFSVNDTVVIYDRIREILKLSTLDEANDSKPIGINEVVDTAVNQTLMRSINTTATTLLPLVGIFIFGGETLKYFALALIIGFILGAYSSIFIASSALAWWRERQESPVSATADSPIPDDRIIEAQLDRDE